MKLSMFLTAAGVATAIASSPIYAQDARTQADPVDRRTAMVKVAPADRSDDSHTGAAASTINLRALRDFRNRFGKVKGEAWYPTEKGFVTYFSNSGCPERVFYDKKGHWNASITYGGEHNLPTDIRTSIRRAYFDMPISFVQIIEVPEATVYIVHVEDQGNIKILRVTSDGEIDVLNEFTKS